MSMTLAAPGEHPGVLSRLYKQASKQNRPLILVLDNSAHPKSKDVKHRAKGEVDKLALPFMFVHQPDQPHKPHQSQPSKIQISKLLGKGHDRDVLLQKRPSKKRDRKHKSLLKDDDDKRFLRSPVIKSLLRISNSLRCNARDDCEDECNNKYSGKKRDECEDRCEIKYSCEESTEDPCKFKDSCDLSDSCAPSDHCQISTRGERLITVTPKCKRC